MHRNRPFRPLLASWSVLVLSPLLGACAASSAVTADPVTPQALPLAAPHRGPVHSQLSALMPRGLTTIGATVLDEKLYVLGGYFGRPHAYSQRDQSDEFLVFDLKTNSWSELPSVGPIQSAVLTTDGRYVYRVGGMRARNDAGQPEDMHSVNEVARFDPTTGQWTEMPAMPTMRSSHQAVVAEGKLYVMGGWTLAGGTLDHEWREEMLVCDLTQPQCQWQVEKMPFDTRAMGATVHEGKIYVLGGLTPEGGSDAVHAYDLSTRQWSDAPALPEDNLTIRAASWRGALYANGADGKVYRLNEQETSWEVVSSLQFPRMFHQLVASNDGVVVLGGIPSTRRGNRMRHIEVVSDQQRPAGVAWTVPAQGDAKNRQGVFLSGQRLYVFGGNNSVEQHDFAKTNFVTASYQLDLGTLQWTTGASLPQARQSFVTTVAGDPKRPMGLAVGGFGYSGDTLKTQSEILSFDFSKETWSEVQGALPEARSQFGLAQWDGQVWLFGGLNYDASRDKGQQFRHPTAVLKLDPTNPQAGFVPSGVELEQKRRAFAAGQLGSHYYITGGLAEDFASVENCVDFDLATKAASSIPCPSAHRLGGELVPVDGKLYLVGGSAKGADGKRSPTSALEVFDPSTNRWDTLSETLPLDNPGQLRALPYGEQLLLYTANRTDGMVQVALVDPGQLASGNSTWVHRSVEDSDQKTKLEAPSPVASK